MAPACRLSWRPFGWVRLRSGGCPLDWGVCGVFVPVVVAALGWGAPAVGRGPARLGRPCVGMCGLSFCLYVFSGPLPAFGAYVPWTSWADGTLAPGVGLAARMLCLRRLGRTRAPWMVARWRLGVGLAARTLIRRRLGGVSGVRGGGMLAPWVGLGARHRHLQRRSLRG